MGSPRLKAGRLAVIAAALAAGAVGPVYSWNWLPEWNAIRRLRSDVEEVRVEAAKLLGRLHSVKAIPALLEAAKRPDRPQGKRVDPYERDSEPRYVFEVLDEILGPRAVPAVLKALSDRETGIRAWAARALDRLEIRTPEAFEGLRRAVLDDTSCDITCMDAARAIEGFGERAVPEILSVLPSSNDDSLQRRVLMTALRHLGPCAKGAVPHLRRLLVSGGAIASDCWEALAEIDADAWAFRAELLFDERVPRDKVIGVFGLKADYSEGHWPHTRPAVPVLEKAFRTGGVTVRLAAAEALASAAESPPSDLVAPFLLEELRRGGGKNRGEAARLLGRFPGAASRTVPALLEARRDEDAEVRRMAEMALDRLGPAAGPFLASPGEAGPEARVQADRDLRSRAAEQGWKVLPVLLEAARSEDLRIHQEAFEALDLLPPPDATVLPELRALLGDRDDEIRAFGAFQIGRLGRAAAEFIAPLKSVVRELVSSDLRVHAYLALFRLGEGTEQARGMLESVAAAPGGRAVLAAMGELRALLEIGFEDDPTLSWLLHHENEEVRQEVLVSLAALTNPEEKVRARRAVPFLIELWKERDRKTGPAIIEALDTIVPGPEAIPVLLEVLEGRRWESRLAARVLAKMGPAAAPAVPALIGRMRRLKLPYAASFALARMGRPAVAELSRALGEDNRDLRSWAVFTLGGMGSDASPALAPMAKLLGDPSEVVRMNAAEALGRLGELAREALPTLERALSDPSEEVRRHARGAIANISAGGRPETPLAHSRMTPDGYTGGVCATGLGGGNDGRHGSFFCLRKPARPDY